MGFIDAYGRNALDGVSRRTQIRYLNELKTTAVSPILEMVDLPPLTLPFVASEATTSGLYVLIGCIGDCRERRSLENNGIKSEVIVYIPSTSSHTEGMVLCL